MTIFQLLSPARSSSLIYNYIYSYSLCIYLIYSCILRPLCNRILKKVLQCLVCVFRCSPNKNSQTTSIKMAPLATSEERPSMIQLHTMKQTSLDIVYVGYYPNSTAFLRLTWFKTQLAYSCNFKLLSVSYQL